MTRLLPLILLAACDPVAQQDVLPTLEGPGAMVAEVGGITTAEAIVSNEGRPTELIIAGLTVAPTDLNLTVQPSEDIPDWGVVPPGGSRGIAVRFRASELGTWDGTLRVDTSGGLLVSDFPIEAVEGVDGDGDGFTALLGDCDDSDPAVNPDATEVCNGIDDNCDERVDEGFDGDNDGYLDADRCPEPVGTDCNDADSSTHPGMAEECDGTDSDCNGFIDDIDLPADLQLGVCEGALKRCTAGGPVEPVYTAIDGYEPVEVSCDGLDNDCDGGVDDFDRLADGTSDCVDDDMDGEREVDGDCDDDDPDLTSETCGFSTLVVTRNDDGFATIDLNTGTVDLVSLDGISTFHGAALDLDTAWFAARESGRIIRHEFATGTSHVSSRFERSPWAVATVGGGLQVLFDDGRFQRRDPTSGGFISEIPLDDGLTTAWLPNPDGTLWICSSSGDLLLADLSGVIDTVDARTTCYAPPAVEGTRLVIPGLDDTLLVEVDTTTRTVVRRRVAPRAVVRAAWIRRDLWATTAVNGTLDIFDPVELLVDRSQDLGAQTQGLWYDPIRDVVWVAVFGDDVVVALDRRTRTEIARLSIPEPVQLFPLPPGGE